MYNGIDTHPLDADESGAMSMPLNVLLIKRPPRMHCPSTLGTPSSSGVQVRVAMRDAELFSLSFACTQRPHYLNCLWRHAPAGHAKDCSAFGSHYKTIPCSSDKHCRGFGTCGGIEARCTNSTPVATAERVCAVGAGPEQGPLCGWY